MRSSLYYELFSVALLLACVVKNGAVLTLQQTVPPGGVAVCPLSTVQYTCVADSELQWRTAVIVGYTTANQINDEAMAGVFNTVLTDIDNITLTSTATIDSVSLGDDGRSITCREISNSVTSEQTRTVQVEGVPLAPSNVAIGGILSSTGSELTVNLTWSNSRCVVVYYVEVTATNTTSITNTTSVTNMTTITNMTATSQHITLTLQIGVVYSFRVRGADSINRLGEWSDSFVYIPMSVPTTAPPSPTATPPTAIGGQQLDGGAIAGIVIGMIVVIVILIVGIIIWLYCFKKNRGGPKKVTDEGLKKAKNKPADAMNYADLELSGGTKGSGKSGTTGSKEVKKSPVDNTRVSYSELEHSGTTTGSKEVKKPPVDTAYEPVDHNKTSAPSKKATQRTPSGSLPNTKPPRSKPRQNQSASVK